MSLYPLAFDSTFPGYPYSDNTEYVDASQANAWVLAIQALESTLGYGNGTPNNPSNPLYSSFYGTTFGSVAARLNEVEVSVSNAVALNASSAVVQPIGANNEAGESALGAAADHTHAGVLSFHTRGGEIVLLLSDFADGEIFSGGGQIFYSTGANEVTILSPPEAARFMHYNLDGSFEWISSGWDSGDVKFVSSYNWDNTQWVLANGQLLLRSAYPLLLESITVTWNGTYTGTTIFGLTEALTAQLEIGQRIEGPGMGRVAVVESIAATSITVSVAPSAAGAFTVFPNGNGDGITTFTMPIVENSYGVPGYWLIHI